MQPAEADTADAEPSDIIAALPRMFDDFLRKVKVEHAVMNGESPPE